MIPYFSIESFPIGPMTFYIWGFFLALAFLTGLVFALWQGKKIGVQPKKIIFLSIIVYLGAIIGARIFFILQRPADFFADPLLLFRIADGGMMFYGGMLGGIFGGWLFIRKWENRWFLISALTPIIPLAMAVGRVGCFLMNDHKGASTSVPWAILWPDGILRHPVALYLILFDLALAGFLWWLSSRHSEAEGRRISHEYGTTLPAYAGDPSSRQGGIQDDKKILFVFLILYSAGRFFLDFTRDTNVDAHYLTLFASQWISLALLMISGIILISKLTKNSKFDISS